MSWTQQNVFKGKVLRTPLFFTRKHLYQATYLHWEQLKHSGAEDKENDSEQRLMAQRISTESSYTILKAYL